jgi:hypothetical protein
VDDDPLSPPFVTKVAVAVRDDLKPWQRLNVTAFLVSGITAAPVRPRLFITCRSDWHRQIVNPPSGQGNPVRGVAVIELFRSKATSIEPRLCGFAHDKRPARRSA